MLISHMSHVIRSNYHYTKLINMINHIRQTVKKNPAKGFCSYSTDIYIRKLKLMCLLFF